MFKIGVLVSGGGTNLQNIIDNIEKGYLNAKIQTVVSNKQEAYALKRAEKHEIPYKVIKLDQFSNKDLYEEALIKHFLENEVDLIVLAGFMVILSSKFIRAFENKIINIHPSLIPAFSGKGFYGIKIHEEALKRGVKISGATVHFVTEGADEGPIILQRAIPVYENETKETLQKRIMEEAEAHILPEAIHLIINNKIEINQNLVRSK